MNVWWIITPLQLNVSDLHVVITVFVVDAVEFSNDVYLTGHGKQMVVLIE